MLGSIFKKGKKAYLPLLKEAEDDGEIDIPITSNDHRNKWHADLRSIAIGFIAAIIVGTLVLCIDVRISNTGADKLQHLLHLPVETVVFHRNEAFIDPPSEESDQAWESLIPGVGHAHGFVAIDHPEQYGLPVGKQSGPYTQNFGVSMYHQLHCLISIRDIFWGLLNGKYNASDYDPSHLDTTLSMRVDLHTNHCFDYLRQGIMCAADMSLEGVAKREGSGNGVGAVTGWGMSHRECRSWDAARRFVEEHQPPERFLEKPETTGGTVG